MYCSKCGSTVSPNLTYCNHCGAKVTNERADTLAKTTDIRYDSFIMSAMAGLFVTGLVAISILLGVMRAVLQFDTGQLLGFAVFSFLLMIGIEGILISRLFRRKRHAEDTSGGQAIPGQRHTKELEAESTIVSEPTDSVTAHTTRTLDPIYSERK